jgi:hypothetical protein
MRARSEVQDPCLRGFVNYPGPGTALFVRFVVRVSTEYFLYCLILSKKFVCQDKVLRVFGQWRRKRKIVISGCGAFRVCFAHKQGPGWAQNIFFIAGPLFDTGHSLLERRRNRWWTKT